MSDADSALDALIASRLRDVPDFPKPGVLFKDIAPLLADPHAWGAVIDHLAARHTGAIDVIAGVEARGFILGAVLAHEMGVGFVPVRKAGRLPGDTIAGSYDLEYGSAVIEVQQGAFDHHERVLLVDDVLATGGTAAAAWELIERAGGRVIEFVCLAEIAALEGRKALADRPVHSLHVIG